MAKKSRSKIKKAPVVELPDNVLPQNILPVGGRVEENKNIYISQAVYKEIHKFTKNKTTNESGGMLVGSIIEEFGKTNIIISGFVEAKYSEGTPTTLKFTHETWDYVHKEIEKKHNGKKIVGWIHTHPDFGIFLSEYDKFIHQNFFNEDHQVAYVVDPIQNIEGFYFWINGNIEKCRGFYIYDKTGTEITIDTDKDEATEKEEPSLFSWKNILIAALSVAVVFLIFSNISTGNTLKRLEKQQQTLADSANQSLAYMQQLIWAQDAEIQDLTNILKEAGIIKEPEVQENTEDKDDGEGENDPTDTTGDTATDDTNEDATGSSDEETSGDVTGTTPDESQTDNNENNETTGTEDTTTTADGGSISE